MTSEKKYPCKKCGTLRSEDEGGKIFTLCDGCWDDNGNGNAPKLCPFCGGKARLRSVDRFPGLGIREEKFAYYYQCDVCACQGPWAKTEGNAKMLWNMRYYND